MSTRPKLPSLGRPFPLGGLFFAPAITRERMSGGSFAAVLLFALHPREVRYRATQRAARIGLENVGGHKTRPDQRGHIEGAPVDRGPVLVIPSNLTQVIDLVGIDFNAAAEAQGIADGGVGVSWSFGCSFG